MKGFNLIPHDLNFDFIGKRFLAFGFSLILLVSSVGLIFTNGLNFGIDFTGGTVLEVKIAKEFSLKDLRAGLNELGLGSISIQEFGAADDLLIRLPQQEEGNPEAEKAALNAVRGALEERYGESNIDYRRTEFVGPQVGSELKRQGIMAVLFSLVGIMGYIWFRFEWQFGLAAIAALAHDSFLTIGLFSLTQMEFNLSTVAAILMIAGYSINDTVVVFDRIREELRRYKKMPLPELFNLALNKTLGRTTMTSLTTLLALIALYTFGGEVIRGFIYALIFGVVIGTYSSIFIASPILLFMDVRKTRAVNEEGEASEAGDVQEQSA